MSQIGLIIGPVLLVLAGWFVLGPDVVDHPSAATPAFDRQLLSTAPMREILADPPRVTVGGFERTCMDCHQIIPGVPDAPTRKLLQHTHIELQHGINTRCAHCHHLDDRNKLVLRETGEAIPYSDSVRMCSQCHPTIAADWQAGMHGRTNGYWNADLGEVERMVCVSCHDPHRPREPAMNPLKPLPAPNTLRMGRPSGDGSHVEHIEKDPLRRVLEGHGRHGDHEEREEHEEHEEHGDHEHDTDADHEETHG